MTGCALDRPRGALRLRDLTLAQSVPLDLGVERIPVHAETPAARLTLPLVCSGPSRRPSVPGPPSSNSAEHQGSGAPGVGLSYSASMVSLSLIATVFSIKARNWRTLPGQRVPLKQFQRDRRQVNRSTTIRRPACRGSIGPGTGCPRAVPGRAARDLDHLEPEVEVLPEAAGFHARLPTCGSMAAKMRIRFTSLVAPIGRKALPSMTRNLAWQSGESSPTSSRKRVPSSACWKRPG